MRACMERVLGAVGVGRACHRGASGRPADGVESMHAIGKGVTFVHVMGENNYNRLWYHPFYTIISNRNSTTIFFFDRLAGSYFALSMNFRCLY